MSMCDCDYDPVECYSETRVNKARKDHKCADCMGVIKKGDGYVRIGYVFDGSGRTVKRCGDCHAVRCMVNEVGGNCTCLPMDGLYWELQEHAHENGIGKFGAIFGAYNAAAKQRGGRLIRLPEKEEKP